MKFFYGSIDASYIDITDLVFEKCYINNKICIPADDNNRAELFGDPFFGILKDIKVENNDKVTIYDHETEISLEIVDTELIEIPSYLNRMNWWQNKGKFISDPETRLIELHKYLKIKHGSIFNEYDEQKMAMTFIKENDIVLELGGNIGRNTCIISQILNDDKNLVTLESNPQHVNELTDNKNINGFNFQIEPSALSKRGLIQSGWNTIVSDEVLDGYFKVNTITWDELNTKYNLNFNTLVADCEGALYYILQDEPDMLANFNKIIIENDFTDITHKEFVDNNFRDHGFQVIYSQAGGWGPCANCFYEVWQK